MKTDAKHVHACPECGGQVTQVHRHVGDRIVALFLRVYRYRCANPACAWEGIISVPPLAHAASPASWRFRILWMAIGVALAFGGLTGVAGYRKFVAYVNHDPLPSAPAHPEVAAGESFDGVPLPEGDARLVGGPPGLLLRRGCAWGVPGRSPYRGSVRQALGGARLPEEVVAKVETMVARGVVSDRVEISRDGIRTPSGKRRFDTTIVAMGFGQTLCFETKVNFKLGHVEHADLYDATDASGTNYAVMVPYVCGNVSVLAERAERPGNGNGHSVPEPGTLAAALAALAAMLLAARFGLRRRPGEGEAR